LDLDCYSNNKKKKLTKKSARERRIKKRKIQTLGKASSIHFWGFHRVVDFYPLVGDRGFACAYHAYGQGFVTLKERSE